MQIVASTTVSEVVRAVENAVRTREPITSFDLSRMNRVLAYTPEDMTVTVEAGVTLSSLQQTLSDRGQWLPIDPPHADTLTVGALLARNRSGPRRYGYGTIRDYLLGIKVVLGDGRVIKAGGKVVKNVAGYDLCKLFVGSHGTLGVIVEATFKVLPRPEAEQFVTATRADMDEVLGGLRASPLAPVVIDAFGEFGKASLVVGFAGTREDVEWQVQRVRDLGLTEPASLAHEAQFWGSPDETRSISVLPSKVSQTLADIAPQTYVARAGNGIIYYRGGRAPVKASLPDTLTLRIKQAFDPSSVLPDLPW